MAAVAERPPWQVRLALPPVWYGLSCDPVIDRQQVTAEVDDYIRGLAHPEKWHTGDLRAGMIESLLSWSSGAAGLGGEVAAMRWDDDETFGMGIATLLVKRLERDGGPVEGELEALRPLLARQLPNDEFAPRVADVMLGVGPGLRMEAVRQPPDIGGQAQHLRLVVEYWVPVEDADLVQMSFGTTNLALASVMTEEFGFIAANFGYDVESA
jgi:hypothetical protein